MEGLITVCREFCKPTLIVHGLINKYSGGLIIGGVFVNEIWGAYLFI